MNNIRIKDLADSRLQNYANLRSASSRSHERDEFIVEGRWCVQRLLASRLRPLSLLIQESMEAEVETWVREARLAETTPVYSLPPEQIQKLVGFPFHRGVLACGARKNFDAAETLSFKVSQLPLALAMIGVSELENAGSMVRTAAALGIEHLLVGSKTADLFSRRAIRVSMGTVFSQKIYQLDQSSEELAMLEQRGIRTIATTLDKDATPIHEFVLDERPAILMVGNEAKGIDLDVQEMATDRVTIPMHGGTDSLNVAVAAAIFMHSLAGQMQVG